MNMARKDLQAVKAAGSVDWTGLKTQRVAYEAGTSIFVQGDVATSVIVETAQEALDRGLGVVRGNYTISGGNCTDSGTVFLEADPWSY